MIEIIAALTAVFTVLTLAALTFAGVRKYLERRKKEKETHTEKKEPPPEKAKKEAADKKGGLSKLSVISATLVTITLLVLTVALLYPEAGTWIWSHTKILGIGAGITVLILLVAIGTNKATALTAVTLLFVIGLFGVAVYDTLEEENIIQVSSKSDNDVKKVAQAASPPQVPTKFCWYETRRGPGWNKAVSNEYDCGGKVTSFTYDKLFIRFEYEARGTIGSATWDKRENAQSGGWTVMSGGHVLDSGIFTLYKDGDGFSGTMISYYDERGKVLPPGEYGEYAITISY